MNIIEVIYWSEDENINDSKIKRCVLHGKSSLIGSKSIPIPPNDTPVLQSKYPILDSHNINISILKDKLLNVIYLKYLLSEFSCVLKDNDSNMYFKNRTVTEKDNWSKFLLLVV